MEYDPAAARRLFAEAGWKPGPDGVLTKNGKKFSISFLTPMSDLRHYNVYLADLKNAGVDAKLEQMSQSTISKLMVNFDFDLYWANWGASRLRDPESQWDSKQADAVASQNYPGVKDKQIDALIEQSGSTLDMLGRRRLLEQCSTILARDHVYLPLYAPYILYGARREVQWEPRLDGWILAADLQRLAPRPAAATAR